MRKIPTLFVRDPENMSRVLDEVNPAAAWVLEVPDDHIATRKYDGTCMMLDDYGNWWARREVKPAGENDPNTGKTVGWEPAEQSSFVKAWREAMEHEDAPMTPGTYELCGPKVQGNPEHFETHRLVPHGYVILGDIPRDFEGLKFLMAEFPWEGVVWHHPSRDGRMAKIKRRDFGY